MWSLAFLNFCCVTFKYILVWLERKLGKRKADKEQIRLRGRWIWFMLLFFAADGVGIPHLLKECPQQTDSQTHLVLREITTAKG